MPVADARYADWKAPANDGQTLLWPDRDTLIAQTRENAMVLRRATHVCIQNAPLPELRRQMRHWIGHTDDDKPLIATGHQTELYHPGVWAKHAMINSLAEQVNGEAYYFAVDTDAPKHLQVRWPGGGVAITDDPQIAKAQWSGLLRQPTPAYLAEVRQQFDTAAATWTTKPIADTFFDAMTKLGLDQDVPLSSAIVNATHAVDWSLGLRHHAMLASPMFVSEPFLTLAHHICANAGEFATAYNAALHEYRHENDIDDDGRPMPDLKQSDGACEVPLWLDDMSDGHRERATLIDVDGHWAIVRADDAFAFDPSADASEAATALLSWLRRHNLRLAPRALTLTMFFRLFLVDQFTHGIGGGRYDQVLDKLIERYFHLKPPHFSVATATLVFPDALNQARACLTCLRQEGHQLKHRVLGEAKMDLVAAITAAPRKSLERSTLFTQMHREIKSRARDPIVLDWERRFTESEQQLALERTLFDRELFYVVQPRERLLAVMDAYRDLLKSHA